MACGSFHTLALNADGDCFAWGSNKFGQCGTQNQSAVVLYEPHKVDFEKYMHPYIRTVEAGANHSAFLDDRRLFMCGKNDFG